MTFAQVAMAEPLSDKTEKLVTGIDVPMLIHNTMSQNTSVSPGKAERRGVSFDLTKDDATIGVIQVGVFGDKKTASNMLDEHLFYTSVGPDYTDDTIGEKAVGWRQRILFVRNNVVISLYLKQPDPLIPTSKSIDRALAEGKAGVRLGTSLSMPRIVSVELPGEFTAGATVSLKIRVAVSQEDAADGRLRFADDFGVAASDVPLIDPGSDVSVQNVETVVTYTASYRVPKDPREPETCWACYATRDCRTDSKKVILPGTNGN